MTNNFDYIITEEQKIHISSRWNEAYVERSLAVLEIFCAKWQLTDIQLIPFYSQKCVFACYSYIYGDAVLKIGYRSLENEYNCLREFAGRNVCEVFDADLTYNVILEQRIMPGNSLLEEKSQEKRINIFASLFENLHVVPNDENMFLTIQDVVNSKIEYIQTREDCKEISGIVDKARVLFQSVCSKYDDKKLLHGDLHQENILLSQDGNYLIIDSDGYIGDPVFDVSRFIMLEFKDDLTGGKDGAILDLIAKLEERLHIPSKILIQCLFVENVVWLCSDLERGETLGESQFIIDNIIVIERLMKEKCR